jgi:hypothetical protein
VRQDDHSILLWVSILTLDNWVIRDNIDIGGGGDIMNSRVGFRQHVTDGWHKARIGK